MSELVEETNLEKEPADGIPSNATAPLVGEAVSEGAAPPLAISRLDFAAPLSMDTAHSVIYCGVCSLPCEYCVFGQRNEECTAWRNSLDEDTLSSLLGCASLEDGSGGGGKKKSGIGPKKKAPSLVTCKVIIARVQRQKRKYVTSILGLDTVPDLKIKDAAKSFGKKFSSGCSISDTATGAKEVVIQVLFFMTLVFNVPCKIFNFKYFHVRFLCILHCFTRAMLHLNYRRF
jgi:density-regulated protein DRP1